MRCALPLLIAPVLLAACAVRPGNAPASEATTRVYKSAGSRQCEPGGLTPAQMRAQLEAAGIRVLSAACGGDGRARIAMCGAPDGRLGILEIPASQVQAAAALGFAPLDRLPQASVVPCR